MNYYEEEDDEDEYYNNEDEDYNAEDENYNDEDYSDKYDDGKVGLAVLNFQVGICIAILCIEYDDENYPSSSSLEEYRT